MITYLQSKGKRVTIGGRGELFWSKSLGLSRYIRWQWSPGSCKAHEKGGASRLEKDQNKPSVLQFAYQRPKVETLFANQLPFQSPLTCWLQNVDADLEMRLCFIANTEWPSSYRMKRPRGLVCMHVLWKYNTGNKNDTLLCIFALTNSYFLNSLLTWWKITSIIHNIT